MRYNLDIKKNIIAQLKNIYKKYNTTQFFELGQKQLYIAKNYYDKNILDILSYHTHIAQYNIKNNILYITKNKYSITTSKHINFLKNNFINFNDSKIVYTDNF